MWMNIAILTTYNSACGIAEYSRNLVDEFLRMGHNVIMFTNKPRTSLEAEPRLTVEKIFGVYWWGEDPKIDIRKFAEAWYYFEKEHGKIDVLNIQYQSSLYEPEGFNWILQNVKCPTVITQHDSTMSPKHMFPKGTKKIVHNVEIPSSHFIPFPTIEKPTSVFSFGMGRNDYSFISDACEEIGVEFDFHDAREQGWLTEDDLFHKMRKADAIVLWYNHVDLKGQSAALRTAISSHRPVIVNNANWFLDAPGFVKMANNKNELQIALAETLHLEYIRDKSFTKCAEKYLKVFRGEYNE
jgi:hypothetical protein